MKTTIATALLTLAFTLTACGDDTTPPPPSADLGTTDASGTAHVCIERGLCTPGFVSGLPPNDTCYDGCNWCLCTTAGELGTCTARACVDAGADAD